MRRVGILVLLAAACGGDGDGVVADAAITGDGAVAADGAAPPDAAGPESDRDRLIRTYLERLQSIPTVTQSSGLRGADLADTCALWAALQPSARAVFLTITARLDGSTLTGDGSSMLAHAVRMTKLNGGDGATATEPGACGGDGNRLFITVDAPLHAALVATADGDGGLADIPAGAAWRNTGDAAGPHGPFDASDETEDGAPRAQVHFFRDPATAPATAPLGRIDLESLVDPFALEIDQDYDCVHASNPMCDYTFYGPLCAPATTQPGTDIYTNNYGSFDPTWMPAGC